MKNKNLFNIKGLKSFRSSLRNRSTSAEFRLITGHISTEAGTKLG